MINVPLSVAVAIAGSSEAFAAGVETHRAAIEAHMMGTPGIAVPIAHDVIEALITRVPDTGPVADRGPDKILVCDYRIVDDTPAPPEKDEIQRALDVLRETIAS